VATEKVEKLLKAALETCIGGVIMHAHDPAEAVEVLNLLLKFFGDGERWIKGA
jgi:hypothetical protein